MKGSMPPPCRDRAAGFETRLRPVIIGTIRLSRRITV
jgi:hypothetical protein